MSSESSSATECSILQLYHSFWSLFITQICNQQDFIQDTGVFLYIAKKKKNKKKFESGLSTWNKVLGSCWLTHWLPLDVLNQHRELSQAHFLGKKVPLPFNSLGQTVSSEKWSSQISTNLWRTCIRLITWPNMGGFQGGREKHFVHRQHAANFLSAPKSNDKSSANGSEIFFFLFTSTFYSKKSSLFSLKCPLSAAGAKWARQTSNPHKSEPLAGKKVPTLVFW